MEGGGDLLFVDRGALLKMCCKSSRVDNQICVEQKVCLGHAHRLAVRTYEFNTKEILLWFYLLFARGRKRMIMSSSLNKYSVVLHARAMV